MHISKYMGTYGVRGFVSYPGYIIYTSQVTLTLCENSAVDRLEPSLIVNFCEPPLLQNCTTYLSKLSD